MKATALLRVGRNVHNLEAAVTFYATAMGFQPAGPVTQDAWLAKSLGVQRIRSQLMQLGGRDIELTECHPTPEPYPDSIAANDLRFQHIAIVTTNINAASQKVLQHGAKPISTSPPVRLPPSSGGVTALKFRDPDGHPLEFLQFPDKISNFYDHSAISISNIETSLAFYQNIGLRLGAQQVNHGPEQDALDGLSHVTVDVIALHPTQHAPHLELLHYRNPKPAAPPPYAPHNLCADRLIFGTPDSERRMLRDPDGHVVIIS